MDRWEQISGVVRATLALEPHQRSAYLDETCRGDEARSNEFETEEQFVQFDRLIRDDNFHMGVTVARTFRHLDVFGSYLNYVSGTDTHDGYAFTAGVTWPFER